MTTVEFHFVTPSGVVLANNLVTIQLLNSGFDEQDSGVVMPRPLELTTDEDGKLTVDLWPLPQAYQATVMDEDSNAALSYKFVVPEAAPGLTLRFQDLIIEGEVSGVAFDQAAVAQIMNAKANALAAASTASTAATVATSAATGVASSAASAASSAATASAQAAIAASHAATVSGTLVTAQGHATTAATAATSATASASAATTASTASINASNISTAKANEAAVSEANAASSATLAGVHAAAAEAATSNAGVQSTVLTSFTLASDADVDNTTTLGEAIGRLQRQINDNDAAHADFATKNNPAFTGTATGLTAAMVGLGNANNTSDSAKPVSTAQQTALNLKANINSPAFTGTPAVPTASLGTNTTQIASTAFVKAELAALIDSSPATLDTLNELAAALGDDPNFATTVSTALGEKAPVNSPALTGTPTAPTAVDTTDTTQLATTAFVKASTGLKAITSSGIFNLNNAPVGKIIAVDGNESNAVANNWPVSGDSSGTAQWWNVFTYGASDRITQIATTGYTGGNNRLFVRTKHDTAWTAWKELGGSSLPTGGTAGQILAKSSSTNFAVQWATPSKATVGLNTADDLPEKTVSPTNLYFTEARARAAVESSNAAMGTVLYNDFDATPPASSADMVLSVQKSVSDKRRIVLISDETDWQFLNGYAVIDKSLDESADLVLVASPTFGNFSNGTIVIPAKYIRPRREFVLEYDVLFSVSKATNTTQVTANGTLIYAPAANSQRKAGHVCRLFMNAAGTHYKVGAHLSGFGYGINSGSGYTGDYAYTAGSDITLAIGATGDAADTCKLIRWRLMGFS